MFSLPIPSEKSVSTVKMLGWLNILVGFWLCLKARLQGSNYVDLQWSSTVWPERHFQSNSVGIEYHNDATLERHLQWNSKNKNETKRNQTKERLITICFLLLNKFNFIYFIFCMSNRNLFESTTRRKSSFFTEILTSDGKSLSIISAPHKNTYEALGFIITSTTHLVESWKSLQNKQVHICQ